MLVKFFSTTKEGYQHLQEWGKVLMTTRKQEALASLEAENVEFEGLYRVKTKTGYLLMGLTWGDNIETNKNLPINIDHRKIMNQWSHRIDYELDLKKADISKIIYELSQ